MRHLILPEFRLTIWQKQTKILGLVTST